MQGKNKLPLMEGLTQKQLEELKLKMEIEKIHFETADKKRSWFYKNSGILIPSIIGLATIMTGIFTGYFSAVATKLENQKHDLQTEVKNFQEKKDTLNKANTLLQNKNINLIKIQRKVISDKISLERDNVNLSASLKETSREISYSEAQRKNLSSSVKKLQSQKSLLSSEVKQKSTALNNANVLLPITSITEAFIQQGNDLILNNKKSEFDLLISKLKTGLKNPYVINYYETAIKDSSISITSKFTIITAAYFASGEKKWHEMFKKYLKLQIEKTINQPSLVVNSSQLPMECFFSQLGYWSQEDRHSNNIIILQEIGNNLIKKNVLYIDQLLSSIIRLDVSNNFGKSYDALIFPKNDAGTFLIFLKYYLFLISNPSSRRITDNEFHTKWARIYTAFCANEITKDNAYKTPEDYTKNLFNRPSVYFRKNIGKDWLTNINSWKLWIENNKELCEKLKEKDFESYKKNNSQLTIDFKYDPSGGAVFPDRNKIDMKPIIDP